MEPEPPQGQSPRQPFYDSAQDTNDGWQNQYMPSLGGNEQSLSLFPSSRSGSNVGIAIDSHGPHQPTASPLLSGEGDSSEIRPAQGARSEGSENPSSQSFRFVSSGPYSEESQFLTPQRYLFPQPESDDYSTQSHIPREHPDQRHWINDDYSQSQDTNTAAYFVDDFSNTRQPAQQSRQDTEKTFLNPAQASRHERVGSHQSFQNASSSQLQVPSNAGPLPSPGGNSSEGSSTEHPRSSKNLLRPRKVSSGKVEKKGNENNFVIMTPSSINAQAGKTSPFDSFDASRGTQRGRKGPLPTTAKENALQVRRLGACFCCHSRKVKCDMERPCKSCKRLMVQVPRVICWQFQDFLANLFPALIRAHFKKDAMDQFLRGNIGDDQLNGSGQVCAIELFSGPSFNARLAIETKFFTGKTPEVLQNWYMTTVEGRLDLQADTSAPVAIEGKGAPQRDDLRKRIKAYIHDIINEASYPEQVTDSLNSTRLPTKVLRLVKRFADRTQSTIAKRALSVYAMHYVMSRHLCFTRDSIAALQHSGVVPLDASWVTSRALSYQIKSIIDELLMREMQKIFELFSKSLKPKARREWPHCLAGFLVLCLFMEAVETACDAFTISQNEISLRNGGEMEFERSLALNICREMENMPFKQFAYQFHHLYQTHSKDANVKAFNPFLDSSVAAQGELDEPAMEMVHGLKELFFGQDWQDMQFLAADDMVLNQDVHPFPLDPSYLYNGRLLSKFLLSFTDERYIFDSNS